MVITIVIVITTLIVIITLIVTTTEIVKTRLFVISRLLNCQINKNCQNYTIRHYINCQKPLMQAGVLCIFVKTLIVNTSRACMAYAGLRVTDKLQGNWARCVGSGVAHKAGVCCISKPLHLYGKTNSRQDVFQK